MFAKVAILALIPACLWDYDTIQMERQRFPNALELITGKFLRHSEEFYAWRVKDRKARLQTEPQNLALYDDLAVAYDKLGQHDKAIETILGKQKLGGDQYQTLANMGTFHIHAGRYDEGLLAIRQAIAINPDAHFGREIYQAMLVEYLLTKVTDDGLSLPLSAYSQPGDFVQYLGDHDPDFMEKEGSTKALKGILGMMRFGHHDSPVLIEVLGEILSFPFTLEDGKRLAARAFLKASYEVKNLASKEAYRQKAKEVLSLQVSSSLSQEELPLEDLELSFREELQEANLWYDKLRQQEIAWIAAGTDVDEMFRQTYYIEPQISPHSWIKSHVRELTYAAIALILVWLIIIGRRHGHFHLRRVA